MSKYVLDNSFQGHSIIRFCVIRNSKITANYATYKRASKPGYKNNELLRFLDFISTEYHLTSTLLSKKYSCLK